MRCRHMEKTRGGVVCNAGYAPYVPTTFEVTLYCFSNDHRNCPFFMVSKGTVGFQITPQNSGSFEEGRFWNENRYGERGGSEGI